MEQPFTVQFWHLFVSAVVPLVVAYATFWRIWIAPARQKEIELAKWRTRVDLCLQAHHERDQDMRDSIKHIRDAVDKINQTLARMAGEKGE